MSLTMGKPCDVSVSPNALEIYKVFVGWDEEVEGREVRWGGCCDTGEIARGVSLQGRHLEGAA